MMSQLTSSSYQLYCIKVQTLSTMNPCCEHAMYYSLEVNELAQRQMSAVFNNIQTVLKAMCATYSECCL